MVFLYKKNYSDQTFNYLWIGYTTFFTNYSDPKVAVFFTNYVLKKSDCVHTAIGQNTTSLN